MRKNEKVTNCSNPTANMIKNNLVDVPSRSSTPHRLLMNLRDLAIQNSPFATEHGNQLKMGIPNVTSQIQSEQIGLLCPSLNDFHLIRMSLT